MQIVNEMKKIWLGMFISFMSLPVFSCWYSDRLNVSLMEFIEDYVFTSDMAMFIGWMIVTIMTSWIIRVLWKALDVEMQDIINHIKERRVAEN